MCEKPSSYRAENIHRCYLLTLNSSSLNEEQLIIFYEFECMLNSDSNKHMPNVCVTQVCCGPYYNQVDILCAHSGADQQEIFFSGKDTNLDVCKYLFTFKETKVICALLTNLR